MNSHAPGSRWPVVFILVVVAVAAGCGRSGSLSKVHSAKGRVVFKDGPVKLLQGATVEFKSLTDPDVAAEGDVQADGTFSISTSSKDGRTTVEGALPGEHRVRVIPPNPMEADSKRLIDARFQQFDTSRLKVQIPSDEEIVIEVHRPR